jgi:hypothetical protein
LPAILDRLPTGESRSSVQNDVVFAVTHRYVLKRAL